MKKRLLLTITAISIVCGLFAQKIDFNKPGRNEQLNTETGYSPWAVTDTEEAVGTFDGVTLTISCDANYAGGYVSSNYWKDGVENKGYKLIGDGLVGYQNGHDIVTSGAVKIDVKISGLSAGTHTLQAYHNNFEGLVAPDIDVLLNGTVVLTGIKQTNRDVSTVTCGQSFVEFQVNDGESVTVSYLSKPVNGTSYGTTSVTINALAFDVVDNMKTAQEPYPANTDYHVDADAGNVTLKWTPATSAVKHHVMFGSSAESLSEIGNTSSDSYTVSGLSSMTTYYWRIDEEMANGEISKGTLWTFRPRHLAFPGAEGYGKYAIGGRGGTVYHVTNLEDNGDDASPIEGSFRYGIKKVSGPRTIVFDVSGEIHLKSRLTCGDKYVTIAGQTAPGAGIMLRGAPFGMASDGITRFIRNRRGHISDEDPDNIGLDGLGMAGNDHSIMDHCSISWTIDEAFSSRGGKSLTLQHTLISEALNVAGHPNYSDGKAHGFAATIGGGEMGGICGSYHHNLLAHCEGRNWSISGGLDGAGYYDGHHDVYNNVVYNWGGNSAYGGEQLPGKEPKKINLRYNYYKPGPATQEKAMTRFFNPTTFCKNCCKEDGTRCVPAQIYIKDNFMEGSEEVTKDNTSVKAIKMDKKGDLTYDEWKAKCVSPEPFTSDEARWSYPIISLDKDPQRLFNKVLDYAGCSFDRDAIDKRVTATARRGSGGVEGSNGSEGGLIDSADDAGGWPTLKGKPQIDTDNDGIPDKWEKAHGLNPNVDDSGSFKLDPRQYYTNLEVYANSLVEDIMKAGRDQCEETFEEYYPDRTEAKKNAKK